MTNYVEDVSSKVVEASSLSAEDIGKLRVVSKLVVGGMKWEDGQSPPGNDAQVILAIFVGDQVDDKGDHMAGDARIYCMPRVEGPVPFSCYTLNRQTPSLLGEVMNSETFIAEVAAEWDALGVLAGLLEDEEGDEEGEVEEKDRPDGQQSGLAVATKEIVTVTGSVSPHGIPTVSHS